MLARGAIINFFLWRGRRKRKKKRKKTEQLFDQWLLSKSQPVWDMYVSKLLSSSHNLTWSHDDGDPMRVAGEHPALQSDRPCLYLLFSNEDLTNLARGTMMMVMITWTFPLITFALSGCGGDGQPEIDLPRVCRSGCHPRFLLMILNHHQYHNHHYTEYTVHLGLTLFWSISIHFLSFGLLMTRIWSLQLSASSFCALDAKCNAMLLIRKLMTSIQLQQQQQRQQEVDDNEAQ